MATLEELSGLPARVAALEATMARWQPEAKLYWRPELTPREHEVLPMIVAGLTNQEIADELCVSERTARTHVSDIISRINAPNRSTVSLWALATEAVTIRQAVTLMLRHRPGLVINDSIEEEPCSSLSTRNSCRRLPSGC